MKTLQFTRDPEDAAEELSFEVEQADGTWTAATPEELAEIQARFAPPAAGPDDGPQRVRAGRMLPGQLQQASFAAEQPHPLRITPAVLGALQMAIDAQESGGFIAADPDAQFATLTTGTIGAPRVWGSNVLRPPRLLHMVASVPQQPAAAVFAQFPQLTLPTAQAASAEGVSLVEYASSAAGSVTLGRFGRWTDLSEESQIGADSASLTSMHRLGIALDLDKILIDAVEAAAGAAVAFTADVPAAIRKAIATVMAATASDDPAEIVVLVHPDNVSLLENVTPTGGVTIGEKFQRFSGAFVYPSTAVDTGFMTVANLRVGTRYFEARGMRTVSDVSVKTAVQTIATYIVAGYGVTLTTGFASKVDVVTP